ncbi:MAG: quinone oxidoreductase [Rhodopirellula sp.]|nr:quinone oxidoreductase [Rhodopirellula sp.]OUX52325.1 MAG: quinone oxidoreductase [Rhodopirellula sp. TMED283]
MKAAYIENTGPPDAIQIGEIQPALPGPGKVQIRVQAVSVNPIDTYIRSGAVASEINDRYIIGCDAAGIIESVGEGVQNFNIGDRVWCTNQGLQGRQGTFAELICIDEDWCYHLPDEVSFETAAACALVGMTAHLGLFREARLQAGEIVLCIGGTGGVGSMVVQMAKACGARVLATAGSEEKHRRLLELGADVAINYKQKAIETSVLQVAPKGVNVFWETRREPNFDQAIEVLSNRGRMVLMAGRDARPSFPVGPFYVKECSLHGFVMFKATALEMKTAAEEINRWMANGKLRPNISLQLPINQVVEAHRQQEAATLRNEGNLSGKIILTFA